MRRDAVDCDRDHGRPVPAPYGARITSPGISMKKLLVIAAILSIGTASAETNAPAPFPAPSPAETDSAAPVEAQTSSMVRNIGFAEQGDAIIVRKRKKEPVPATRPVEK